MSVVANLAINLDARSASAQLQQFQQRAQATQQATERLGRAVDDARRASEASQPGYIKLSQALGVLQAKVKNTEAAIRSHIASLREVQSRVEIGGGIYKKTAGQIAEYEAKLKRATGTQQQAVSSSDRLANSIEGIARIASFGLIVKSINDLATSAVKFERLQQALKAVTGSSQGAAAAMQAVYRSTAITGQSTETAARGLTQMLIAARGTAFEGGKAVKTFEQLNALTVAYAGDQYKAEKAQLALQQMMSKGLVSMEELRGQMGDALPGAIDLFRRSYKDGTTSLSQFIKLVGEGKVSINDFTNINKVLGKELDKVYGKGYSDYIAKQAQFNQAMDKLRLVAGQVAIAIGNALLPKITGLIQGLTNANPTLLAVAGAIGTVAAAAIGLAAALTTVNFALTTLGIGAGAKQLGQAFKAGMAGPPQIKALTLVAAAALGGGAALGGKAMVDEFDKAIRSMQERLKSIMGADFKLPDAMGDFTTPPSQKDQEKQRREAEKERRDALAAASRLNQLVMENLRLNTDAGALGKDRLSQLDGQLVLLRQLMALELKDLNLTKTGAELAQARINKLMEYRLEFARVESDIASTTKEIQDLTREALGLRVSLLGGTLPPDSPLTQELKKVQNELAEAERQAEQLLNRLSELGGTSPGTGAARATIGELRGDIAAIDPRRLASQRMVQPDIDALTQQNEELRNAGREISLMDQIIIKYGKDWDNLDPSVKKHLQDVVAINEELRKTSKLPAAIKMVKDEIKELTDPINQIISAASAIGDAFANSFKGLISGSMSAKEALRSFFEATASHFLDMAAQIIAKQIQMFILNTALSFLGGSMGVGGGGGGAAAAPSFGGSGFNPKAFTPGLKLFAEGGFVTRPTNALIGEAGEAEYVIPASKMRGAMERYAAGARGDSVISGAGGGSTATTATGGGPLVVEVRAQMERINSVDYVTAEQFQAGIRQAAQQGAAQGEQRTLRRLQHSPATRRRVGV